MLLLGLKDPFAPFQNLVCTIFFGGVVDALRAACGGDISTSQSSSSIDSGDRVPLEDVHADAQSAGAASDGRGQASPGGGGADTLGGGENYNYHYQSSSNGVNQSPPSPGSGGGDKKRD